MGQRVRLVTLRGGLGTESWPWVPGGETGRRIKDEEDEMKLIEGMKLKKELQVKAEDLRKKIAQHCAHMSIENPVYGDQRKQVDSWLQAHQDIVKQIRNLTLAVQQTNLATKVTMEIGGEPVELSIAEWILRRRELANMEKAAWEALSDRGLKDQVMKRTDGQPQEIKVVRYYDPVQRDTKVDQFKHEPGMIDRKLEVVNASTELIGFN